MKFITQDRSMSEILKLVNLVGPTDATVLISGETGTGKEIVAQMIHQLSRRYQKTFLPINCAALAEGLQESELFGHMKGSFTGASGRQRGKFEIANMGTIFLDEVNEMSLSTQVKLLRVLQTGEYSPVGFAANLKCDVRVVAAAGEDLMPLIEQRKFRNDLYYRLNIIHLKLPPLRKRIADVPLLATHFVDHFVRINQKRNLHLSDEAIEVLMKYEYPGNVRELENIIHRAVILCRTFVISPELLVFEGSLGLPKFPLVNTYNFHAAKAETIEKFERRFLASALQESGGIVSYAALQSGLSERNFHEKLRKYKIKGKTYRNKRTSHRNVLDFH